MQSCLTHAISFPLCSINRRHWMSLMTQHGRSGTRGLSDYLWFYLHLHLHLWITCDYLWLFVVVNEPTCDSEVCVVDISIWTVCDAYCELCVMPVMFIWVGYVIRDRTIKTGNIWSLCRVLHSAKRPFAKCQGKNSRQRGYVAKICTFWASICRVSEIWHSAKQPCLPSAPALTLGKYALVCRVSRHWHSANMVDLLSVKSRALGKHGCFAKCQIPDTQQRLAQNVQILAMCRLCRVFLPWHSVKGIFDECNTRQSDHIFLVFMVRSCITYPTQINITCITHSSQ